MAKLKNSISKEIITCYYAEAKKNKVFFPKYKNLKVKNELNKLKKGWTCLDTWITKKRRVVKLQHLISKEIIVCLYQSAKINQILFPKYNKELLNLKAKNELNKLKYNWICLCTWTVKKKRLVKLEHLVSKEIIISNYYQAKKNQVKFPKYEDLKRFKNVNELGLNANPQYVCISPNCGYQDSSILVSIKRKNGFGKIKIVRYSSVQRGKNPFNENKNRVEINTVHPLYKKMFKRLGLKFETFQLAKKSIIDFKISHPQSEIINVVETKQSEIFHNYSKEQKKRYTKLANLKQYNIHKIYFSDPKGSHKKHGFISIQELEKQLKKDFNLK